MWVEFAIACFACMIFLFLPGYLLLRSCGFYRTFAFAASPCFSIAFIAIEAIIYYPLGITCTWENIVAPPMVIGICAYVVRSIISSSISFGDKPNLQSGNRATIILLVYLLLGICVTIYLYLSVLDSPAAFSQEFDNLFHLSLIQRFAQTGQWSSLAASIYSDPLNPASNPTPNLAMYPSAWHAVCAVIAGMFSENAPFATNVVNTIFIAIVFPSGMFFLMRVLFPRNNRVVIAGGFASVAFTSFPSRLLWWGPIYPTLAAYCLIPTVIALFIVLTQRAERCSTRIACVFSVLFGGMSLVLLQPSAVFALIVFLAPYCSWRIFREARVRWPHGKDASLVKRLFSLPVLLGALFILVVVVVWMGIYYLLSDSEVLSFTWDSLMSLQESLLHIIFVNYCYSPWVPALAFLISVGVIYSLWRGNSRWLVASYVTICAMLAITLSIDGELKHIVGGFWYTDQMRLASLAAIFAMPLASLGFYALLKFIKLLCGRLSLPLDRRMLIESIGCVALSVLLLFSVFSPYDLGGLFEEWTSDTAMGRIRNTLKWTYNKHPLWYYTNEEDQFVNEIMQYYADEQFINNPFDGSCWAYGAQGMDVFYRAFDVYGYNLESSQSKAIRLHLSEIASNVEVQEALRPMKSRYVLQLDSYGKAYDAMYQWMYHIAQWTGFNEIDENTPGFELVMSRGDMRLFRITCLDDDIEDGV